MIALPRAGDFPLGAADHIARPLTWEERSTAIGSHPLKDPSSDRRLPAADEAGPVDDAVIDLQVHQGDRPTQLNLIETGNLGPPRLERTQQRLGNAEAAPPLIDLAGVEGQAGRIGVAAEDRTVQPGDV